MVSGICSCVYSRFLLRHAEIEWMEQQNIHTMNVFWYWCEQMRLDPMKALFDDDLLAQTWHAHHLHPNVPVILMALFRGRQAGSVVLADASPLPPSRLFVDGGIIPSVLREEDIPRTRLLPLLLGLTSVLLLLVWVFQEAGLRQALWTGALVLMMPQFLARLCSVSTGSAVVVLWLVLLWTFRRAKDTLGCRIAIGTVLGVGLGTKATIVLAPICYMLYVLLELWKRGTLTARPLLKSGRFWLLVVVVGLSVHLVLWPWLWRNPVMRTVEHLAANRLEAESTVEIFGFTLERPPFFYPFWFLVTTTPIPILLFMFVGIWEVLKRLKSADLDASRHSWVRLHLVSTIVLLSLFLLPLRINLNGAEFFLPLYPSMAVLASEGLLSLCQRVRLLIFQRAVAMEALALIILLLSVSLDFRFGESVFHYRNIAGTTMREPSLHAFPRTAAAMYPLHVSRAP